MTGKEILFKALERQETPRPAWVPFVGVHGGLLIGKNAEEYLKDSALLTEGLLKANELYKPDGLPIVFDLQVEAEILGCALKWATDVPPSVYTHPLQTKEISDLPEVTENSGRFPIIIEALHNVKERIGDEVAMYGLVCGPFTLALHLLGNDIFLMMFDDPDGVKKVINYCAEVASKSAQIYIKNGADVIAVVDPMTSQISSDHFREFATPGLNIVFDSVRENQAKSSMFVCGDAYRNLEEMCLTTADSVSVDEQIPIPHLRTLCEKHEKAFGGNIRLTSVLLLGDEDDAKLETIDILKKGGTCGFILSPGCDLPYHTPPANLQAVSEMVHNDFERNIAETSLEAKQADSFEDINVPDYHAYKPVIIDVITLDSTSCAPCQYMMEAVSKAAENAFVKTYVNEHKIKVRDGLGMMTKLGVKNLPTICIDGEAMFESIIPDHKTLVSAIERHAIRKNIGSL